jgi:hypothetical protein
MEPLEAEKASIIAEIEESVGIGKERNLKFGSYYDTSFGSKIMNYSRNFGIDYLYRPSAQSDIPQVAKFFLDYDKEENCIQYFLQFIDHFDDIDWYEYEEDESNLISYRDKLTAMKVEVSPFEDFREALKRGGFALGQSLDSIRLVKSFSRGSRRKLSRKDRKRERRDKETKELDANVGMPKFRKDRIAVEMTFPIEQKLALERITIAVAKAIVDGDLSGYLGVASLLLEFMQGTPYSSVGAYLLPVGNMIALMFDKPESNPFGMYSTKPKSTQSKSFSSSDISKHETPHLDDHRDPAVGYFHCASDAGSTIGSTYAEIGTDTTSMGDEMNEEDMLVQALALSVGGDVHKSDSSRNEEHTSSAADFHMDISLDASTLEFSAIVDIDVDVKEPFSATAPFKCKEFVSAIYGGNASSRVASNLVPIRAVFVSLIVALNVSLESKLHTSDAPKSIFPTEGTLGGLSNRMHIVINSSAESIYCLEFLILNLKAMIEYHCSEEINTGSQNANIAERTMEWHLHMYILSWSMHSLLRLTSELTSKASMKVFRSPLSSTSNSPNQVKRSIMRLRDVLVELMGLVNSVIKPAAVGRFDIAKYPDSFPVNLQLADVSSSMFGSSNDPAIVILDYRFCHWNILHNLRLASIDAFLSLFHIISSDPVSRQDALLQLISTTSTDSEHIVFQSLQKVLLIDLQHALGNGEVIFMKEYNFASPEELYHNYFLQRLCVEILKADEQLLPYFCFLTTVNSSANEAASDFDIDERYASSLQKLMNIILSRLNKRALTSNFYGTKEDNLIVGRLWGELDFIRCAQSLVFDKIDRDLESYWNNKGLIYQEFRDVKSHSSLVFSDDMKVVTHVGAKAWCSVLTSNGFEPNSGVYEWTIKIDHCSKGHVFVGIATSEMACDKDGYIGVDKYGWGLIGSRALWHARGKVRSDYGNGFGSGSLITAVYNSDNHTLSFRCDGNDWGVAFDNIPKVKVFPAFSLHEKNDQISILRCICRDDGPLLSKTRGNSLDLRADTWPGFFADYCQTVLTMSDKTVASSHRTGEERILLSPIVTILSASLLAYVQSPKFSYLADSPIIVSILPYLTVYSRRLANLSDKLSGRKGSLSMQPSGQSYSDAQCIYGDWQIRSSVSSLSVSQVWQLSPIAKEFNDLECDGVDAALSLNYVSGKVSFPEGSAAEIIVGIQEKSKFKLSMCDKSGNVVVIDGRLSLCGRYFYATRLESGRLSRSEGLMVNLDENFVASMEIHTIKKLAYLAFSSCSLLAGKLVGDSISSDRFRDLEIEDTTISEDASFSISENVAKEAEESNEEASPQIKDWTDSVLFSGGLALNPRNLEAVMKFLSAYLSKYSPSVRDLVMKRSMKEDNHDDSHTIEDYLASWLDIVLPLKSDVGEEWNEPKMSDVLIVGSDESHFYSALLEGKSTAASLDEYISLFVGQSAVLKIGGAIMTRTRRMVIASLIQHSGCFRVCEAEMLAILNGEKSLSDKPVTVLLEIWRAAIRVIENVIRIKQETGDSYESICRSVCRKAEFLGQIDQSKACSSINSNFMFMEKSQIVNDRWYLEAGVRIHSVISKLIGEATEFFTNSNPNVDAFYGKLIERTADAFLRIAGFKSFLYLLGKVDREWQTLSFFAAGPGLHHEYHTMVLTHLPVFRQNAVVMNAQQHYGSGLRGVCQKVKSSLQYSFEQLYELITQHLTKSTWAKDREGQFAALKAWNILIQPDDHLLLNRMNLFRTLHTVLDDVRGCIDNRSINEDDEMDLLEACYENAHREQLNLIVSVKREFSLVRHMTLAQLVLDTVYSLASQIAGSSENVADDYDLGAAHLLRRTSSGPDTLSRSLFDLMFSEYLSSIKPMIMDNLETNMSMTATDIFDAKSPTVITEKSSNMMKMIEGEDYLYRILNLLKMVAQSKNCLKLLQSVKWTTAIVSAVGFGTSIIQRRVFRLLRILLTTASPSSFNVCVPSFFEMRPILKLESTSDEEEFVATCSMKNHNSLNLYVGNDADAMICFLLEAISLMVPESKTNTVRSEGVQLWLDSKQLRVVVGHEALSLARVLLGIPAWRTVAYDRFTRILTDEDPSLKHAKLTVTYVLGGAFERKRVGGLVTLRPFALLGAVDPSNRATALSYSRAVVASLSFSSSSAEVVLVNQSIKVHNSDGPLDFKNINVSYSFDVQRNAPVRCVKLPLSDIAPMPEIPILSCTLSNDLVQQILSEVPSILRTAEISIIADSKESPDIDIVDVISTVKLLSSVVQNSSHVQSVFINHLEAFVHLIRIGGMDGGNLGLASLEAVDSAFADVISKITSAKSRPPSTVQNATEEDVVNENMRQQSMLSNDTLSSSFNNANRSRELENREAPGNAGQTRDLTAFLSPFAMALRGADPAVQSAALNQMLEIGLPPEWCEFSLRRCHYNVEMAINMCLEHGDEMPQLIAQETEMEAVRQRSQQQRTSTFGQTQAQPQVPQREASRGRSDNSGLLRQLIDMGFPPSWCARALESGQHSNLDSALGWFLSRDEDIVPPEHEEHSDHSDDSDIDNERAFLVDNTEEEPIPLELVSGAAVIKKDLTCLTQGGGFPSVGCKNHAVSSGKWYYELTVFTAGCVQVGWATTDYTGDADAGQGVGDDCESWAYDGWRSYLWHFVSAKWGTRWKAGDVVGCAVDLDAGNISFYLNGFGEEIGMGRAVEFNDRAGRIVVFPCVSFNRNESVKFNFGGSPFVGRLPEGYAPYLEAIRANIFSPSVSPSWVVNWAGNRESGTQVKMKLSAPSGEKIATKMLKRYFKQDESKVVGPETTDFFNSEVEGKVEEDDHLHLLSLARKLLVLYCRLICLRCLKSLSKLDEDMRSKVISGIYKLENSEAILLNIIQLLQVTSLYSNRTKTYHLLHSMQSCTSVGMSNLGSVLCAGGQPALFELQATIHAFMKSSLESRYIVFVNEAMKCIASNLTAVQHHVGDYRWASDATNYLPFVVRDRSKDEKHWKRTPSISVAHMLSSMMVSCCFQYLSKQNDSSIMCEVLLLVENLMSLWSQTLACSIDAICLISIKMLSYITQDLIVFRKDHNIGKAMVINPDLMRTIRSTCIKLLECERLSQPVLSEYNTALLELAGAVSFIHESFCVTNEENSIDVREKSHLQEQQDEETSSDHCWEVRTGRLLSSEGDWKTWTGDVKFKPFALPGATNFSRWKERQDLPPELLPGCKVFMSLADSPDARLSKEFIKEDAEQQEREEQGSFPLSRFRMLLERTAAAESGDSKHSNIPDDVRIGTVVEITSWPGTNIEGNARIVKWDDNGSMEVVRWGADDMFDVAYCVVTDEIITHRYPNPPTMWQKLSAAGFGKETQSSVILRLREMKHSGKLVGIMEWPQFSATVFCRGERTADSRISLIEERLLTGSSHSGWESHFGCPGWRHGTQYSLQMQEVNGVQRLQGSFEIEARVANRSFNVQADIILQDAVLFSFDKELHPPNIVVSLDSSSVSKPSGGGQGCAVGSVGFSSGVHYWEFKIEQGDIGSIFVGVIEKPEDARSMRLTRWQGWGMVNNRSSYHTAQLAFGERVNVYGDHFQSGDMLGVVLDLNRGTLSFFLDGLKYGEHIMADLGVAHEGLHLSSSKVKPRTFYPIVGLSKPMDRVTITKRWLSAPGFDGVEGFMLYERAFQLLYSWNLERASAPLRQHFWIYREGWRHYNRWMQNDQYRCRLRVNIGSISISLNKTVRSCVQASLRLGLSHPLLHGDRIVFTKSAGKTLDAKEEAVILGSYRDLLWYKLDSHDTSTEEMMETGANVWVLVASDIEGMSLVKRGGLQQQHRLPTAALESALPRIPEFHGGFVRVFHENGAVMRDGIEIDTSEILCSVPVNTTVFAIERRINSSNIYRYLVSFGGHYGWISERMRGGSEEAMVRRATPEEIEISVDEIRSSIASHCKNVYVLNRLYQQEVFSIEGAMEQWERWLQMSSSAAGTAAHDTSVISGLDTVPVSFEEYLSLSSTTDGGQAWSVEADMQLSELISKLAYRRNKHPMNLSMQDVSHGLEMIRNNPSHILSRIDPGRILARAAILREANLIFYHTLPMMTLETPEERMLVEVFGSDSVIDVKELEIPQAAISNNSISNSSTLSLLQDIYNEVGTSRVGGVSQALDASDMWAGCENQPNSSARSVSWTPSSLAKRWRSLRRLLFTQTKIGFWDSVLDATTTITPLPADEYEDPREIKTIKLNRIQANVGKLSTVHSSSERMKLSVFGQLHKELRSWPNPSFRRAFIGKGHGGQKRAFKVKFVGEGVNDYGGPYRAVFEQIVDELRCDSVAVGGTKSSDRCLLPLLIPSINRVSGAGSNQDKFLLTTSSQNTAQLQEFTSFFGKLIGMSTRHSFNMAVDLSALVWRPLVRLPVSLAHLETVDNFTARNLQNIIDLGTKLEKQHSTSPPLHHEHEGRASSLSSSSFSSSSSSNQMHRNNDFVPDDWADLSFVAFLPDGSKVPLIPGGENMPVNLDNWRDYVRLMERQRLQESSVMFTALRDGLASVLPIELFPLFTAQELEHLLCGNAVVDIELLRRCAEYEDLDPNGPVVQYFWEVLQEMSDEDKTYFLRFVWARSRMPTSAKDFPMNFKLQRLQGLTETQTDQYLPHAQTCFFSLALPLYSSKDILREKLLYAIKNSPNMDADVRLHTAEGWGDS